MKLKEEQDTLCQEFYTDKPFNTVMFGVSSSGTKQEGDRVYAVTLTDGQGSVLYEEELRVGEDEKKRMRLLWHRRR